MRQRIKNWAYAHNLLTNKAENCEHDRIWAQAEVSDDYTAWDEYMKRTFYSKKPVRWWWFKPERTFSLKPFMHGGDEHNRHNYVFGFPWTGQVVVASRKKACVHHDKKSNTTTINLALDRPSNLLYRVDAGHGVEFYYDTETGSVVDIIIQR